MILVQFPGLTPFAICAISCTGFPLDRTSHWQTEKRIPTVTFTNVADLPGV